MVTRTPNATHVNPVYGSYLADPFVWRRHDVYYAIGTGAAEANGQVVGKVFPLLQSTDFYRWHFASNALVRPDPALGANFWAPEIVAVDGLFYLYYSVGHGDKDPPYGQRSDRLVHSPSSTMRTCRSSISSRCPSSSRAARG